VIRNSVALTDISQDVSCPASARVSAARTVLELALKGVELEDLEVLVEQLEVVRDRWLVWVDQTPAASILASGIGVLSIRTWLDQISRAA
jgi:hypothetical protein